MFDIPLHLLVVHFPIAMALAAAVYDARAYFSHQPALHGVGYILTLWAAPGSALAFVTGLQIAGGGIQASVMGHAAAGLVGGIGMIVLAMLRYSVRARSGKEIHPYPALWIALQIGAAAAMAAAAISGHRVAMGF